MKSAYYIEHILRITHENLKSATETTTKIHAINNLKIFQNLNTFLQITITTNKTN
jgi:hypothetical protein